MSPKKPKNTERINVFLQKEVLEQVKEIADERGLNVSSMVRFMVCEWILQWQLYRKLGTAQEHRWNDTAYESRKEIDRLNMIRFGYTNPYDLSKEP